MKAYSSTDQSRIFDTLSSYQTRAESKEAPLLDEHLKTHNRFSLWNFLRNLFGSNSSKVAHSVKEFVESNITFLRAKNTNQLKTLHTKVSSLKTTLQKSSSKDAGSLLSTALEKIKTIITDKYIDTERKAQIATDLAALTKSKIVQKRIEKFQERINKRSENLTTASTKEPVTQVASTVVRVEEKKASITTKPTALASRHVVVLNGHDAPAAYISTATASTAQVQALAQVITGSSHSSSKGSTQTQAAPITIPKGYIVVDQSTLQNAYGYDGTILEETVQSYDHEQSPHLTKYEMTKVVNGKEAKVRKFTLVYVKNNDALGGTKVSKRYLMEVTVDGKSVLAIDTQGLIQKALAKLTPISRSA